MTYPWAPLEPLLCAMFNSPRAESTMHGWSDEEVAKLFGCTRRTVGRMKVDGLTIVWADRCAIRLGRMPASIWPEWEADSIAWADSACARREAAYALHLKNSRERQRLLRAAAA